MRIRPPSARPASCPLLKFEHFSREGNSADEVVYFEKRNLLTFSGKHFAVTSYKLPHDLNLIQEVFMTQNYKGFETISVRFLPEPDYCYVLTSDCQRTIMPELKSKDKVKLTSMLNTFGKDLVEDAKEVGERLKRMKRQMLAFQKDVSEAYPLFHFKDDLDITYPNADSNLIQNMERDALALTKAGKMMASSALFSKKRKASD